MTNKVYLLSISILLPLFFFAGCKKEETPEVSAVPPSLIGFWKMTGYENIWLVSPPNQTLETGSDTGSLQIRFHADSTYRVISSHSGIPGDTGSFVAGNGALGLISVSATLPVVLFNPRYSFDAYGRLLLNFPEFKEYTLNDTGASPVLGDYTNVVHTYTFQKQ
jgi:hypothetical protein